MTLDSAPRFTSTLRRASKDTLEDKLKFALATKFQMIQATPEQHARIDAEIASLKAQLNVPIVPSVPRPDTPDSEKHVSDEVEAMIKAHPLVWYCERRNSGTKTVKGETKADTRYIAFSRFVKLPTGVFEGWDKVIRVPDYSGLLMDGKFFVIETKERNWHMTPSDKQAKEQLPYIKAVLKVGGRAGFATSADTARAIIEGR